MSINRIKGDDGVIIDSNTFLELPKATSDSISVLREGMVRYNKDSNTFEGAVLDTDPVYRNFAILDATNKLPISTIPNLIPQGFTYSGSYNPVLDDIDPPSVKGVYTPLPVPTADNNNHYWVVGFLTAYAQDHYNQTGPSTSPTTFTPDNPNGNSSWIEIKYYFSSNGDIQGAFGRISSTVDAQANPGLFRLSDDPDLKSFDSTDDMSKELALTDGDWIAVQDALVVSMRDGVARTSASAVLVSPNVSKITQRELEGTSGTVQSYIDAVLKGAVRRGGDSMVSDGSAANGRIALVYGTEASPAIVFNNNVFNPDNQSGMEPSLWSDASTGMYRADAGGIGFSYNGVKRMLLDNACTVFVRDSIVPAQDAALKLVSSTNTSVSGITSMNDILYFTSGGGVQATMGASGLTVPVLNVTGNSTLGTTATDKLTVNATSTFGALVTINANAVIGKDSQNTLSVLSNTTFDKSTVISLQGAVTIGVDSDSTLTVNSLATFNAPVIMQSTATVGDNMTIGTNDANALDINSTTTIRAPLTANNPVLLRNNTTIGNDNSTLLDVFSKAQFESDANFLGNVSIGNETTDVLYVKAASAFDGNVFMNANAAIGNDNTDTLTVNAVSTFNSNVSLLGNTVLGDTSTDTLTIGATSTVKENITFNKVISVGTGTTASTVQSSTGLKITLPSTGEFNISRGAATVGAISDYGVLLPVLDSTAFTVKVGSLAYDATKKAVVAGIDTAWVDISTRGSSTAFTATWTTDATASEIYTEITVANAMDVTVYENKSTYFQKRSDVIVRVFTDKVRVVLPSTGTAFAGRVYIQK